MVQSNNAKQISSGAQFLEDDASKQKVIDMHCHVGFMTDPSAFARDVQAAHMQVLAVSVTPQDYWDLARKLQGAQLEDDQAIFPALGLHPWWVSSEESLLAKQLQEFDRFFPETVCIGEVGLDFSARRRETREQQLKALRYIFQKCTESSFDDHFKKRVLSLHCVHAYDEMLYLLKENDVAHRASCIFHWFSGSSEQLHQAIKLGCYFSLSKRMVSSGKGREYAKVIPENKLLLETDAPFVSMSDLSIPSVFYTYQQIQEELRETLQMLSFLRGVENDKLSAVINKNARSLLNLKDFMQ